MPSAPICWMPSKGHLCWCIDRQTQNWCQRLSLLSRENGSKVMSREISKVQVLPRQHQPLNHWQVHIDGEGFSLFNVRTVVTLVREYCLLFRDDAQKLPVSLSLCSRFLFCSLVMSGERRADLSNTVRVVTSLERFSNLLRQIVLLICVDSIKLYILSSVVICNYAIEINVRRGCTHRFVM